MCNNRKLFIRKQTYFVTFRAEEGLPLPANALMNEVLSSILCAAYERYEVGVCAYLVMGNHIHMLIVVTCPIQLERFMQYFKREAAHAINRLLGRRKHTVFCDGYDSPIILDVDKAIDILTYIYTNPQEAGLTDSIDEFPGLSSWAMFVNDKIQMAKERITRSSLKKLPNGDLSKNQYRRLVEDLEGKRTEKNTFTLTPYAFLDSFNNEISKEEVKKTIINRVRARELELRLKRTVPVIGAYKLSVAGINTTFTPKKFGKRMICLSTIRELRSKYIAWYRAVCAEGAIVLETVRNATGSYFSLPPGLFAPGGMLYANVLV